MFNPRRLLDLTAPFGYLESDKDFVLNNLDLCVGLLNAVQVKIRIMEMENAISQRQLTNPVAITVV